jgi:hypothetical protein
MSSDREPREDQTNLGHILVDWDIITLDQLELALEQQKTLRGDDLLGKLLVANGACSEDEINTAMSAQASMRSVGKCEKAVAIADIAIARRRRHSIFNRREVLAQKARQVERSISSGNHQTVGTAMLAKPDTT